MLIRWVKKYWEGTPGLTWVVVISGIAYGIIGVLLVTFGNPANTGICASCFLEGTAGALGLHNNLRMMYIRPELIGFILGAFFLAVSTKNFSVQGGASPIITFVLGGFTIIGSAMFMGCPVKLLYRFSAGDLTTLAGVAGLLAGVWVGVLFMREGFYLGDTSEQKWFNGLLIPLGAGLLLVFLLLRPAFIQFSARGSGAVHAPWYISLGAGLFLGSLAQRSRFCIVGGLRNFFLARDKSLLTAIILAIVFAAITAALTGQFHLGMYDQPGSHLSHSWSFLGMFLTGYASVMLGGCPLRQMILSGEGNVDAGVAVMGMLLTAGLVHNWDLSSTSAGPTFNGKIAVLIGLLFCLILSLVHRE